MKEQNPTISKRIALIDDIKSRTNSVGDAINEAIKNITSAPTYDLFIKALGDEAAKFAETANEMLMLGMYLGKLAGEIAKLPNDILAAEADLAQLKKDADVAEEAITPLTNAIAAMEAATVDRTAIDTVKLKIASLEAVADTAHTAVEAKKTEITTLNDDLASFDIVPFTKAAEKEVANAVNKPAKIGLQRRTDVVPCYTSEGVAEIPSDLKGYKVYHITSNGDWLAVKERYSVEGFDLRIDGSIADTLHDGDEVKLRAKSKAQMKMKECTFDGTTRKVVYLIK